MIEIIILAVFLTAIAGLWDLRTTEVPDHLLYAMIAIGVFYWIANWLIVGDIISLYVSLAVGTLLLVMGLVMYKKGQWGGADAWVLAAIGYMIPFYNGELFIIPYLLNFVIVSIIYTVIYAVVMGLRNISVFGLVKKDLKHNWKIVVSVPITMIVLSIATLLEASYLFPMVFGLFLLFTFLVFFWRYAVVLEKNVFKKKIPASKLRIGDVLDKGNWVGLTARQIKHLRGRKRYVVIKDGMRFVPVFAIALVLTLLAGNVFFMIF